MKNLAVFVFILFSPFASLTQGQEKKDTIHLLPQVEVVDEKIDFLSLGLDFMVLDSVEKMAALHQNIGELLQNSTSIFIKDYGPSGISSMGFRGLGANQSMVYWNGVPLSSPNLGMIDVSLIPTGSFSNIKIQMGGGAAIFGSGNMAGALYLDNKVDFSKKRNLTLGMTLGSENQYHTSIQHQYATSKIFSKTQLFGSYNKNDFLYKDLYGRSVRRKHAGEKQLSLMQDFALLLSKNQWIHLGVWIQSAKNEIPASTTTKDSDAIQHTDSKRIFAKYHLYKNSLKIKFRTSLIMDDMLFSDPDTIPVLSIESLMKTIVWNNNMDINYQLIDNMKFFFLINYKKEKAISNNYSDDIQRHTSSASLGINSTFFQHRLKSNIILSKSLLANNIPLLFSFNSSYLLSLSFLIKAHLSTNYRLPTFNDLYWVPLGNPNLKPEKSKNIELGFVYSPIEITKDRDLRLNFGLSMFHYLFNHRILWKPKNGVWHPLNLSSMLSQGIETNIRIKYISTSIIQSLEIHYTYANSTTEGLKMMYAPAHSISASYYFAYDNYLMSIKQTYTSSYYTNMDNSLSLPRHSLTSIEFSKEFRVKSRRINIGLKVKNLFNIDYQLISFYPMPGRSFHLKLLFAF